MTLVPVSIPAGRAVLATNLETALNVCGTPRRDWAIG